MMSQQNKEKKRIRAFPKGSGSWYMVLLGSIMMICSVTKVKNEDFFRMENKISEKQQYVLPHTFMSRKKSLS